MTEILEVIQKHWGIILSVAGLIASLFWLKLDSRYAKKQSLTDLTHRVTVIEHEIKHLPSAKDVSDLRVAIVEMNGETKALSTEVKGLSHQVALLLEKEVTQK
ncbi:DUF2730 family protein [Pasteurella multocida]|uniref:DUF2730 family protein n=1 Tax=Pasteurella multocida TaxID=747 RepID=UPI00293137E8|nr:DUF2730 family protein [Pasteurella multocida]WNY75960.1 DUF2730 family protein [Pasteurella multocida]